MQKRRGWHWMMKKTQGASFVAQHLYDKGRFVWNKRKPEEAYKLMIQAKNAQMLQKRKNGNFLSPEAESQMGKIQKVIEFLENAGIGKCKK